ncbi:F0F1 ATP synthase assembly protein [Rhodobacteraceae bacterium RKSG542]|uniref:AtpZ/AtpI family protein n=1 Tax=Pseudovibrio flavus TaxID=2529854 RepID=UPI0012BB9158|nr:AtpZ/AtpI family protein [Pseudovibrio flavus]MTI18680.1 F0F1 ATP synthase assembly protein [Pseudovibrio flavus]
MPEEEKRENQLADDSDSHLSERLKKLGQTLESKEEGSRKGPSKDTGAVAGLSQAWKMSSEFIAGVLVGAGMGWLADTWLGTKPWGIVIFLLLGFAAGILNMLRSLGRMAEPERRLNQRKEQDK